MLRQRILSTGILLPCAIAIIWFGNPWFSLLVVAVAILCGYEFYRMVTHSNQQPLTYFGLFWVLLLVLSPYCPNINVAPVLITLAVVLPLAWFVYRQSKEKAFNSWAWTVAGILYVGWMLSYWVKIGLFDEGRNLVLLAILTTIATDIGAFFIGRTWGKHQLSPVISPKKTWEGAIGGFLSAILVCSIFGMLLFSSLDYWQIALLGCLISIFAQLGDLVESLLKRNAGVKDSGRLIPGHGGVLDRIDSHVFVGVVVYYYIVWIVM